MTNPARVVPLDANPLFRDRSSSWQEKQARARSGYTSARISRRTMAAARALLDALVYYDRPRGVDELLFLFVEHEAKRRGVRLPHHPEPKKLPILDRDSRDALNARRRQAPKPAKRKAKRAR
jgi:hypothetical protein